MPATNYSVKSETTSYETGYPLNSEYYTYYPTWFNGQTTINGQTTVNGQTTINGQRQQQSTTFGQNIKIGQQVEDIVISGVSGRFPESENVEEFAQGLLLNGMNKMVGGEKQGWEHGLFGLQKKNVNYDGQYYGINNNEQPITGQMKSLVEVTYEAIFDSGLNPTELKGTRTGVFIGTNNVEQQTTGFEQSTNGLMKPMWAKNLSSLFEFKGPNQVFSTPCSSSLVALDSAINAIKSGECDYAIVYGINLPETTTTTSSSKFNQYDVEEKETTSTGKFETIGAILLQKKTSCKRFYAKLLHSKLSHQELNEQDNEIQTRLLKEIYAESDIDPTLVTYVETHGSGCGENKMLKSIGEVYASPRVQRTVPLFVGQTELKNGDKQTVTGIVALIKMLISIQRGIIPANLHYQEPTTQVLANGLFDGRVKLVNTNTKFRGGLMALNSFCNKGINAHILLQPNNDYIMSKLGSSSYWNQDLTEVSKLPRMFNFCATTQQGLEQIMEQIKLNPTDLATHFLLHTNSKLSTSTHPFRGFVILNSENEIQQIEQVKYNTSFGGQEQKQQQQPIWYVFNGIGSNWKGMGKEMMKIETFRHSIMKSAEYLMPFGLNLIDLMYGQENKHDSPLNAFVGITAIQIALVDCLRQVGIEGNGFIGYSIGELGCAYADNCLTAEQTLMIAYHQGKCIEDAQLPTGGMAIVGLTWEQCQQRCPSGLVPACHNSRDTCMVSGPKKTIIEFVEQLKNEGIMGRLVDSSDVAYHSYYMTSFAPSLRMTLEKVIPTPKQRSSKWISTSIPEQRWETETARYSSPYYYVNNLCSPVLFNETLKYVPTNAIVIEIGPNTLLDTILKRTLTNNTIVSLIKKESNILENFWTQLGQIYIKGINVDSIKLFVPQGREQTIYPVPVNTQFLSHFAKYHYQQKQYNTPKFEQQTTVGDMLMMNNNNNATFKYTIDLNTNKYAYLNGNQINGQVVYPTSGYLYKIWKSLAKMNGYENVEQFPVTFENVEIHRQTVLTKKTVFFQVTIMPTTGLFELVENGSVVVSGRVYVPEGQIEFVQQQQQQQQQFLTTSWTVRKPTDLLEQEEIYRDLKTRGYEYQGEFKSIVKSDIEGTYGELAWNGKWVSFLESMLQMNIFGQKNGLLMPTYIKSIKINPKFHLQQQKHAMYMQQPFFSFPITFNPMNNTTVCGGIEMNKIVFKPTTQLNTLSYVKPTGTFNFVPYVEKQIDGEFVFVEKLNNKELNTNEFVTVEPNTTQYREFVEYYINECKRFSTYILRKIEYPTSVVSTTIIVPTPMPKTIEQQFEKLSVKSVSPKDLIEGGKLLQLLVQAANMESVDGQYFYKIQKLFNDKFAYWKALEEDRVLNFLNKKNYYLKSIVDTVLENTPFIGGKQQQKLKVLEISPSFTQFFGGKINNMIKNQTGSSFLDYHFVPTTFGNEFNGQIEEFLGELNKKFMCPIQKAEWNLGLRQGQLIAEPPKHLKDFDLVIFNGSLNTLLPYVDSEVEMKNWIKNVMDKVMKPQGFMFVHELTNNFETLVELNHLEQVIFRQQPSMIQQGKYVFPIQKYQTEYQWRQIIEDAGFYPVSLKSDGLLSTMFLYRKPAVATLIKSTPFEEKIFVDDMDQINWTEKVKVAIVDKQINRVWIITEKTPTTGIFGLINNLRQLNGGEKIRCIFVADKQPIVHSEYLIPSINEQVQMPKIVEWTQLFEQIRKCDLVMNVIKNGKWGSFRNVIGDELFAENDLIENEKSYEQFKYENGAKLNNTINYNNVYGDMPSWKWMPIHETKNYKDLNELEGGKAIYVFPTSEIRKDSLEQNKSVESILVNFLKPKERKQPVVVNDMDKEWYFSVQPKQEETFQQYQMKQQYQQQQQKLIEIVDSIKDIYKTRTLLNNMNKKVNYLMPTKTIEKLNTIEFVQHPVGQTPVVVIHPIEGHVNMLKSWAKHMKYPVFGVQYTQEAMQFETIEQLADFYWQQIEKELMKQSIIGQTRVHLCGYSFGSLVALEMAARKPNMITSFTLLDGGFPIVNLNKNKIQFESLFELESEALFNFAQQYLPTLNKREFIQDLIRLTTFDQRIKYVVRELMTKSQFQFEPVDLEQAARSYVAKMFMSYKYQPTKPLRLTEMLLVKCGQKNNLIQTKLNEEDFLGQVFNGKLNVQIVDGDYRSFLEGNNGLQVAHFLNEYLLKFF